MVCKMDNRHLLGFGWSVTDLNSLPSWYDRLKRQQSQPTLLDLPLVYFTYTDNQHNGRDCREWHKHLATATQKQISQTWS